MGRIAAPKKRSPTKVRVLLPAYRRYWLISPPITARQVLAALLTGVNAISLALAVYKSSFSPILVLFLIVPPIVGVILDQAGLKVLTELHQEARQHSQLQKNLETGFVVAWLATGWFAGAYAVYLTWFSWVSILLVISSCCTPFVTLILSDLLDWAVQKGRATKGTVPDDT